MPPTSRLDMWADRTPCSLVNVDCLLPTGVLVPIQIRIEATLAEIKSKLWREAGSFPLFNFLKESTSYVFVCVNLQGKTEELVDENRQLIEVRPFRPLLKLIERIGDREEKLHSSKIGTLVGKNLDEYQQMQNAEVDEFRNRYRVIVEGISRERSTVDWEARAMYAYPPDVDMDGTVPEFVERNLMPNRRFLVNVAIKNNKASMKDLHAFNVSADALPDELLTLVLKKRGAIMGIHDFDNPRDYVLKIIGKECYLLGNCPLLQYQYIRDCIAKSERPTLSLVQRASLKVELNVTGKSAPGPESRPPPPVPSKDSGLLLWDIDTHFKVKIASAFNVNIIDHMKVTIHAGIFHGSEGLSSILTTKEQNGPSPVWNEYLEFDLKVSDVPRMARLCMVLYGVDTRKRSRRESIALAWVNTSLFDFRGHLRQGIINLNTWPVTETLAEQLNPIGTVVSNINTNTSPTVLIEFSRYANTVVYPAYDMIVQLAAENTHKELFSYFSEDEVDKLKKIIQKEPLSPIFENDKEFVWKLRIECRENYPYALGKLLSCVKWHCKEDVAQMQVLLQIWSPLEAEMALELLDHNYADEKVREFAVRCIEKMGDGDLEQYMLQLVQVLKYENYLDCDLAKFLLKRALKNQNIGHILFWLLKAEMHNPEVSIRFGLMLEAYLRGAPEHMKKLHKQVEALNKLKTISSLLYNVESKNKEKGLTIMRQCLQQKTYHDALSKLTSPLDPSFKLRRLKIEKCKFMDSKMKPLWLDFENFDELGGPVKIIFKSGDDLRQDMLTLQLIRVMDRLWKHNGLDLEMIPYGCLCTGNNVGLIQVVDNAETLAKIQKEQSGAISGAFGKTCILDWLLSKNDKDQMEEVTKRFTLSCAGYCVATYVLGIGDRHSDNIMVTASGKLFHIDFGHILGNFKSKFGIRRERVPVVLTDHFVHVITKGRTDRKADDTEEFQNFKNICERAFVVLRRKGHLLINLFLMMLSAGIPELRTVDDINYIRKTLHLDVSEEKAVDIFNKKLKDAWVNGWKTSLNWAIHNQVHKNG